MNQQSRLASHILSSHTNKIKKMNKKKGNGSVQYKAERESYFYMYREPEKMSSPFWTIEYSYPEDSVTCQENLEVMIQSQIIGQSRTLVSGFC